MGKPTVARLAPIVDLAHSSSSTKGRKFAYLCLAVPWERLNRKLKRVLILNEVRPLSTDENGHWFTLPINDRFQSIVSRLRQSGLRPDEGPFWGKGRELRSAGQGEQANNRKYRNRLASELERSGSNYDTRFLSAVFGTSLLDWQLPSFDEMLSAYADEKSVSIPVGWHEDKAVAEYWLGKLEKWESIEKRVSTYIQGKILETWEETEFVGPLQSLSPCFHWKLCWHRYCQWIKRKEDKRLRQYPGFNAEKAHTVDCLLRESLPGEAINNPKDDVFAEETEFVPFPWNGHFVWEGMGI